MRSADRLRIAQYTYSTQPRGGVLHTLAVAEALHDLGHDVVLHALDDTGRGFVRPPRCPYVLVPVEPARAGLLPFVHQRVAEYIAAWNPTPAFDVHHAHDGISGNALATLVARGCIADFVRTVHHIDRSDTPGIAALEARAITSAATCLVVSDGWRERVAHGYDRVAAVVPNGVDVARFHPASPAHRAALRAQLGYGPGPLFVTIGGIEARKNTVTLLEAFAALHARSPQAQLVIAGGASVLDHSAYRQRFDARAGELGLAAGAAVQVTGAVSDARIVALLQVADAFVFPSLIEGFGLVVLEALACATPVVISAIPPFTEFLTAHDAVLVDPNDPTALAAAMRAALEPSVAAAVAARGPALASRFSWPASARVHVEVYRALVAERAEALYA